MNDKEEEEEDRIQFRIKIVFVFKDQSKTNDKKIYVYIFQNIVGWYKWNSAIVCFHKFQCEKFVKKK